MKIIESWRDWENSSIKNWKHKLLLFIAIFAVFFLAAVSVKKEIEYAENVPKKLVITVNQTPILDRVVTKDSIKISIKTVISDTIFVKEVGEIKDTLNN